jgi:cytoskeletal protein CcmA (bactofilin family)
MADDLKGKENVTPEVGFWESLAPLEDQHWLMSQVEGEGRLYFTGKMRFAGHWKGELGQAKLSLPNSSELKCCLFLMSQAVIEGVVRVDEMTVAGRLTNVKIEVGKLIVLKGAYIEGEIKAQKMIVEAGAIVQGRVFAAQQN